MNILSIALKEIKHDFRDRRSLMFILVFPIVLMLILGLTLSNAFSSDTSIEGITVLVKDSSEGMLAQAFQEFEKGVEQSGIRFENITSTQNGPDEVQQNRYTAYVEVTNQGLKLYGNDHSAVESNIVQGMLSGFTDKYNAASTVLGTDADQVGLIFSGSTGTDYIKETSVIADRRPGSTDYYALAMTVMLGMWGAMAAGRLIRSEIVQGTDTRLVASPARKSEIFAGKVLGSIVINMLCILILVLFSKLVFKAYWGEYPVMVGGVLLSEVIMAVSFGLAVSYLLQGAASRSVLLIFVQLASFFGGAYFPVTDSGGGAMDLAVKLSPIRWANHALTELIYSGSTSAAWQAMGLNLVLGAVLLITAAVMMSRREGI
ncbi:hypothetical protein PAECIP111892_02418 [Paenibacillus auburnensis]|uniref:ABC-2 type transporter transmembrane domain-containing protein n=1 Tax=Paenibacillus auburnensis TaxID=2905649 RepID=A0ABN8GCN0_9BACL|nr:ABC transporter permease [Paenibacillus auburnensis]CAH1204331.1 hypothetical protein PAECIP111892_02418 [Paenibacillus auburnensis]